MTTAAQVYNHHEPVGANTTYNSSFHQKKNMSTKRRRTEKEALGNRTFTNALPMPAPSPFTKESNLIARASRDKALNSEDTS